MRAFASRLTASGGCSAFTTCSTARGRATAGRRHAIPPAVRRITHPCGHAWWRQTRRAGAGAGVGVPRAPVPDATVERPELCAGGHLAIERVAVEEHDPTARAVIEADAVTGPEQRQA